MSRIASVTFDVGNLVTLKENVDAPHGTSLSNGSLVGLVHWVNQRTPRTTTPRMAVLRSKAYNSSQIQKNKDLLYKAGP